MGSKETNGTATEAKNLPLRADVAAFARRSLGLRFEMRFCWETEWWPVYAEEVAKTLAGYYESLHSCLERMREGKELPSGLAYYRMRKPPSS
jgi:hypothetical protein